MDKDFIAEAGVKDEEIRELYAKARSMLFEAQDCLDRVHTTIAFDKTIKSDAVLYSIECEIANIDRVKAGTDASYNLFKRQLNAKMYGE